MRRLMHVRFPLMALIVVGLGVALASSGLTYVALARGTTSQPKEVATGSVAIKLEDLSEALIATDDVLKYARENRKVDWAGKEGAEYVTEWVVGHWPTLYAALSESDRTLLANRTANQLGNLLVEESFEGDNTGADSSVSTVSQK